MKNVILIHQKKTQHYRVSIYNYLHKFLRQSGYNLEIVSDSIQEGNPFNIEYPFNKIKLTFINLYKLINRLNPEIVILFINLKNLYLFPLIFYLKISKKKIIYWGHGIDLQDKHSRIKNYFYNIEHMLSNAMILYADSLKGFIKKKYHNKIFIANNTLNLSSYESFKVDKKHELSKYNIYTKKNIIYVGRIQKRKRIEDLLLAFKLIKRRNVGLIFVGPDSDNIFKNPKSNNTNIFILGPIYGIKVLKLLHSCDIYCMPGAIGLSIVDALYCGLPVITEKVDHGPEIMYLKDGINGFFVEKGDYIALAEKLCLLLDDDVLRKKFSISAKKEIDTNGNINNLCNGFLDALNFSLVK